MRVVIVEDEKPAAQRLEKLLHSHDPSIEVLENLTSVKHAVMYFLKNPDPDIIFMDVQLSDGLSFEIFEYATIRCPIIFTTAFDEYAIKAFKVNSIAYLLKPIDEEDVKGALEKYRNMGFKKDDDVMHQLTKAMKMMQNKYKSRFLVKLGDRIHAVPVHDILYFYTREKASFCHTTSGKNYLLDHSLDQLEAMVDPENYFRINRQYLICFNAVKDIISYSNSRLKIVLEGSPDDDVIVSCDRVNDFKNWLDR